MRIHSILIAGVTAAVTILLRFMPFLMLGGRKRIPPIFTYFSGVLPYAIMGMLVVYCLRGIQLMEAPHGLPELIAVAVVVGLHSWKKNTLLSIVSGTVLYMLLIQLVF